MKFKKSSTGRWFKSAFALTIVSGFAFAATTATDNYVVKNKIVIEENPMLAVFTFLLLGAWIGLIVQYFSSNLLGTGIDNDFKKIRIYPFKYQKEAAISGGLSAVATIFALWGGQIADPSVVIVLMNIVMVYLVFYDVIVAKTLLLKSIIIPALLIILGSILASMKDLSFSFEGFGLALVVLLLGRGLSSSASKVLDQKGVRKENEGELIFDPVNYAFLRFFWLAVFGTLLAFGWSLITHNTISLILALKIFFPIALPAIIFLMFFVTIANATEAAARKVAETSVVSLLVTFQVVVIIPITLIGDLVQKDIFGSLPTNPWVWGFRIAGMLLVIFGVRRLVPLIKDKSKKEAD